MHRYISRLNVKIVAAILLSAFSFIAGETIYRSIEIHSRERSFSYICTLVLPRLQVGATREVQDTLISLFSSEINSEMVFPLLLTDGKVLTKKDFKTNQNFECRFDSIPAVKVEFYYNVAQMWAPVKVFSILVLSAVIFALLTILENFLENRAKRRAKYLVGIHLGDIARQVAHDIRSPVMALNIVTKRASGLSLEMKEIAEQAIERIQVIANDLLTKSKFNGVFDDQIDSKKEPLQSLLLNPSIQKIVLEKTLSSPEIKIEVEGKEEVSARCNKDGFERALSNIIQNAIEATREVDLPLVTISSRIYGDRIQISIVDNGIGIPSEVLDKIGQDGFTLNKRNGNGLGFSSAKRKLKEWGGSLSISSKEGHGTIVTFILRR